jgi:hypothetical protein
MATNQPTSNEDSLIKRLASKRAQPDGRVVYDCATCAADGKFCKPLGRSGIYKHLKAVHGQLVTQALEDNEDDEENEDDEPWWRLPHDLPDLEYIPGTVVSNHSQGVVLCYGQTIIMNGRSCYVVAYVLHGVRVPYHLTPLLLV